MFSNFNILNQLNPVLSGLELRKGWSKPGSSTGNLSKTPQTAENLRSEPLNQQKLIPKSQLQSKIRPQIGCFNIRKQQGGQICGKKNSLLDANPNLLND